MESIRDRETTHNLDTAGEVFRDFVAGMYDEAKNHPGKLAVEAGIGAAVTLGTLALSPEIFATAAIVGTVVGVAELGKGVMKLADQVRVIDNANHSFSESEINQAHQKVRSMGVSTMDILAVTAGGVAATEAAGIVASMATMPALRLRPPVPGSDGIYIRPALFAAGDVSYAAELKAEQESRSKSH